MPLTKPTEQEIEQKIQEVVDAIMRDMRPLYFADIVRYGAFVSEGIPVPAAVMSAFYQTLNLFTRTRVPSYHLFIARLDDDPKAQSRVEDQIASAAYTRVLTRQTEAK